MPIVFFTQIDKDFEDLARIFNPEANTKDKIIIFERFLKEHGIEGNDFLAQIDVLNDKNKLTLSMLLADAKDLSLKGVLSFFIIHADTKVQDFNFIKNIYYSVISDDRSLFIPHILIVGRMHLEDMRSTSQEIKEIICSLGSEKDRLHFLSFIPNIQSVEPHIQETLNNYYRGKCDEDDSSTYVDSEYSEYKEERDKAHQFLSDHSSKSTDSDKKQNRQPWLKYLSLTFSYFYTAKVERHWVVSAFMVVWAIFCTLISVLLMPFIYAGGWILQKLFYQNAALDDKMDQGSEKCFSFLADEAKSGTEEALYSNQASPVLQRCVRDLDEESSCESDSPSPSPSLYFMHIKRKGIKHNPEINSDFSDTIYIPPRVNTT